MKLSVKTTYFFTLRHSFFVKTSVVFTGKKLRTFLHYVIRSFVKTTYFFTGKNYGLFAKNYGLFAKKLRTFC